MLSSELVEGLDVDGLDKVLHLLDLLLHNVSGDLVVLDGGTDDDLEDTVGNGFLLPLGLPPETVHLDLEDLVSELLKIGVLTPGLDFPNDDRLGDDGGLAVRLGGLGDLLEAGLLGLLGLLVLLVLARKRIELILISSLGLLSLLHGNWDSNSFRWVLRLNWLLTHSGDATGVEDR